MAKKKRLSQREKAERAHIKKQRQEKGILPPDKPRLNRKRFAAQVWAEFNELDVITANVCLRNAIGCMVSPEMDKVTAEEVGVLKLMKLAVETAHFMEALKAEGRDQYTLGEFAEKVCLPVMKL